MEFGLGSPIQLLCIPLFFLIGERECGIGSEMKPDGTANYRMHHQLNMRGPHHPRSSEATNVEHKPHYQPHRQQAADGSYSPIKITQDTNLLRDAEHIREDLENLLPSKDTKKMTPEELEFYYFKLHDFDNNTKLDGLEILQAIQHVIHNEEISENSNELSQEYDQNGQIDSKTMATHEETEKFDDDFSYFVELIDKVLEEDDLDNDGFLSYVEYVQGRKKDQLRRDEKKQH